MEWEWESSSVHFISTRKPNHVEQWERVSVQIQRTKSERRAWINNIHIQLRWEKKKRKKDCCSGYRTKRILQKEWALADNLRDNSTPQPDSQASELCTVSQVKPTAEEMRLLPPMKYWRVWLRTRATIHPPPSSVENGRRSHSAGETKIAHWLREHQVRGWMYTLFSA